MCDCEELRERVAWLEGELGLRDEAEALDALRLALGMPRGEGIMLMLLFRAAGHIVTKGLIDDTIPAFDEMAGRDPQILKVYAHRIRKRIGEGCVETHPAVGYSMTPAGLRKVQDILDAYAALRFAVERVAA